NGSCSAGTGTAGNGKLCLDATDSGDYAFIPNQWHHVAFTYDGNGSGALYADGIHVATVTRSFATPAGEVWVGSAAACGSFNGRVDELRVLSRGLSGAELRADYLRAGAFRAEVSTTAGQAWEVIAATAPHNGRYLALSGAPGSTAVETLTLYHLDLPESTTTLKGAGGTNQVRFVVSDRAGNEVTAGPYTVLKDTTVLQPSLFWMVPLSTQSIYLVASATDNFSGVKDFQFEISSSALFNSSVSTSPWVETATYTFTGLLNSTTYFARVRARDNLLNTSIASRLDQVGGYPITASTSTFGSVYYSTAPVGSTVALQGAYTAMLKFTLAAPPRAPTQ
ncbi:MAG: LamG-like jellyroll fold domain-containing protein, partial [Elusimicrobiota bacterium]